MLLLKNKPNTCHQRSFCFIFSPFAVRQQKRLKTVGPPWLEGVPASGPSDPLRSCAARPTRGRRARAVPITKKWQWWVWRLDCCVTLFSVDHPIACQKIAPGSSREGGVAAPPWPPLCPRTIKTVIMDQGHILYILYATNGYTAQGLLKFVLQDPTYVGSFCS